MVNEMAKAIGKIGSLGIGGLYVDVKILDVKQSYGQTRYLVTPMAGCESVWVAANRVRFADKNTLEVMEDSQ